MKRKLIILILALMGLLLFTSQTCSTNEKSTSQTSPEEVEEELFADDEESENNSNDDITEQDLEGIGSEVGGADFNLTEAWIKFTEEDYEASLELLDLAADYLKGEGEDLVGKEADHLLLTSENIQGLILMMKDKKNRDISQINASFNNIGLNLVKDYLAMAVALNESPEDNEYFVEKAMALLEIITPNLKGDLKVSVSKLNIELIAYDNRVAEGTLTEADNLQDFVNRIQQILVSHQMYFTKAT